MESARSIVSSEYTITNTFKGYTVREYSFLGLVAIVKHLIQIKNPLNHSGKLRIKWGTEYLPVSHETEVWDRGKSECSLNYTGHIISCYYTYYIQHLIFFLLCHCFLSVIQTVSKALWKSLNAQNSFFYQTLGIKISEIGVKTYNLW